MGNFSWGLCLALEPSGRSASQIALDKYSASRHVALRASAAILPLLSKRGGHDVEDVRLEAAREARYLQGALKAKIDNQVF